jgi:alkylation response protein AidB-like acyl-CoA dehydrogenase
VPGGYRFGGRFRFASGINHSTMLACGTTLCENGQPIMAPNGMPRMRVMVIPISKAKIIDTWNTTGLRGTGSHDFVVEDVFVPADESFSMAEGSKVKSPLYSFAPLFLVCHAGLAIGIARGVLDAANALAQSKTLPPQNQPLRDEVYAQECIGRAETALAAARSHTYSVLGRFWDTLCAGKIPTPQERAEYRLMMVHSHDVAKKVITDVVDMAASNGVLHNSTLDRGLRDITTACQHRAVHARQYRVGGRLYLGLESGDLTF